MIEERDKGKLVHEFLGGVPHVFATIDSNDEMSCGLEGTGADLMILWAKITMELMQKMETDDIGTMLKMSLLATSMRHIKMISEEE